MRGKGREQEWPGEFSSFSGDLMATRGGWEGKGPGNENPNCREVLRGSEPAGGPLEEPPLGRRWRAPTLLRVVLDQELPGEDMALAPALRPHHGGCELTVSGQVFS